MQPWLIGLFKGFIYWFFVVLRATDQLLTAKTRRQSNGVWAHVKFRRWQTKKISKQYIQSPVDSAKIPRKKQHCRAAGIRKWHSP